MRLPPVESRENSIIDEDNSVLDFSSGNAEVKESTVSKVNETDPNQGERGFSTLQEATMFAGLEGESFERFAIMCTIIPWNQITTFFTVLNFRQ